MFVGIRTFGCVPEYSEYAVSTDCSYVSEIFILVD